MEMALTLDAKCFSKISFLSSSTVSYIYYVSLKPMVEYHNSLF